MFRNARLGTKITLGVSLILVVLLFSGVGAYVYVESRRIDEDIKKYAAHVLGVLESTHIQAMLNRGDKKDNNPVLNALNGTIDQFNKSSKDMKLWLVMGPKVLAFQKKAGSEEVEPPQDDIDREAIETGTTVQRMAANDIFRVTRPVILSQGMPPARNASSATARTWVWPRAMSSALIPSPCRSRNAALNSSGTPSWLSSAPLAFRWWS